MPAPMKPSANRVEAKRPATGLSALAASAALWMWCLPWLPSVAAVVTMIENITMFEKAIPENTSIRPELCFA